MRVSKDSKHWIIPPWDHQVECINRALGRDSYGIFFEVGAGKTKTVLEILRLQYAQNKRALRTLVLCPPIVQKNWPREFSLHTKIGPREICNLIGTGAQREKQARKDLFYPETEDPRQKVLVMGYQTLLMKKVFHLIEKWKPEVIIFDEVHYLKNSTAQRSKQAFKLAKNAQFRYGLTGTPIANTPEDLFGIYKVLDLGHTFGTSKQGFKNRYFYDANAGMPRDKHFPNYKLKTSAMAEITAKLQESSMSVKKEDCLDLPPLVKKDVFVELSQEQKRAYKEMKRDLITFIKGDVAAAKLAVTKALRLQQIASGHIKTETGEIHDFEETPRDKALSELLEGIVSRKKKVIVWAVFKQNYTAIKSVCERLGVKYVEVHGGVTQKQKFERIDSFNQDPDVSVFIGHPDSVGIGINLVAAQYSIFYSRNFSFVTDEQAEARNYRGGSEIHSKVTRINLVAEGTIDERVAEALAKKQDMSEKVLREVAHTF